MSQLPYPTLTPSSRSIAIGDYPIKKYNAMDGAEIRILYGSEDTNATMQLTYKNITDDLASEFIRHFRSTKGTFERFPVAQEIYDGWDGDTTVGPDQIFRGEKARWRHQKPPTIASVRPGISTVQISLITVL